MAMTGVAGNGEVAHGGDHAGDGGSSRTGDEQAKRVRRSVAASAMGNATERFDYGVYAATATYLTAAFFPGDLGTLGTMLGFAVSFVLRPLRGLAWGPLGDRLGRRRVLRAPRRLLAASPRASRLPPPH